MGTTSEKLTYLNTTKTLIKDNLNLGGANITTEPFRQYSSKLKGIYKDFLANGTDILWNNWEKVSGTGETLSLSPTIKGKMKVDLKGNTYQYTTTGKNLFDINTKYAKGTTQTLGGVTTIFNNDQSITLNGTIDSGNNVEITGVANDFIININSSKQYYLLIKVLGGSFTNECHFAYECRYNGGSSVYYRDFAIDQTTKSYLLDTSGTEYITRLRFWQNNNRPTFNNFKVQIAIYENDSTTNWEEYTGNQPSPSPSYPQDIQVVSGDNSIEICGRNLYYTDSQTKTFTSNAGSWKYLDGTSGADYSNPDNTLYKAHVEYGKTYTFTCSITASASVSSALMYYDNTTIQTANGTDLTYNKTFTASKTGYILMRYYVNNGISVSISNVQLELGDQPTTYTPYVSQTYPISLGNIELCKIGTYQDKIYKDNGKWYLNKQIGKITYDGTEYWGLANNVFYQSNSTTLQQGNIKVAKSNYFQEAYSQASTSNVNTYNPDNSICGSTTGTNRFYIKCTSITSTDSFKTWLSTHNIEVYYVLATPTYTEITDTTLLSQLEALAYSYNEQTNISQVNDDMPFVLDITALKEMA